MLKKITAVILVLSVLMKTACSSKPFSLYDTPIKFNDPFSTEGEDMSFSDLKITEIDVEGLISSINRMKELSEKVGSLEELKKLYMPLHQLPHLKYGIYLRQREKKRLRRYI